MKKPLCKKGKLIALASGCTFAGLVGFGLQYEYQQTAKDNIWLKGKEISLSKFYAHTSFDPVQKDWRYADNQDTVYFAELQSPLYNYEQRIAAAKRKPLIIKQDTLSLVDTCNLAHAYALTTVQGASVPTINGSYSSQYRRIKVYTFLPADSLTAVKAKKFFNHRNPSRQHTVIHEAQHDRNYIYGITTPAQSPRQLIENMYHDEFIAHLRQLLAQWEDYKQNHDLSCFSFSFFKKAIEKKQIAADTPLTDSVKHFIAGGIMKHVLDNPQYIDINTRRAVQNAAYGNSKICQSDTTLQNIILNKLYTVPCGREQIAFYPYFQNPPFKITAWQIEQVASAIKLQDRQPDMLQYLRQLRQDRSPNIYSQKIWINKLLHQYRD